MLLSAEKFLKLIMIFLDWVHKPKRRHSSNVNFLNWIDIFDFFSALISANDNNTKVIYYGRNRTSITPDLVWSNGFFFSTWHTCLLNLIVFISPFSVLFLFCSFFYSLEQTFKEKGTQSKGIDMFELFADFYIVKNCNINIV